MSKHIQRRFAEYHQQNPHVYELFKRFAVRALGAGKSVLSAKFIFERIRWEAEIETQGDAFKVNNNYPAYYARKFMEDFPSFGDCFRTRQLGW
ncbi:MAG: hypothetical protein EOR00_09395 [Mesorhizobium sp.]|uniref:hypothetical protein n=1 Tax=Mesorhizobium sp. TaxID=1871066 RepID=UPI000FE816AE|nr:hypothetical protein [Mesorhizobium sp.]RWP18843.1 MAG: hypothetical protein EOR00_09395 [Mesorhizobium sp.]